LSGILKAVTSKSYAHRLLICACLCERGTETFVGINNYSEDIDATIDCLNKLGSEIIKEDDGCRVTAGINSPEQVESKSEVTLNCKESGSTLRFLIPVAACLADKVNFTGVGRLPERPLDDILQFLDYRRTETNKYLPLEITGGLKGNNFAISGAVSSQFISGLLFALPLIGGGTVEVIPPFQSKAYVDMTIGAMRSFGISATQDKLKFTVNGKYTSPLSVTAEGDWSNSSFFLAAGAITGERIEITNLNINSAQSDKAIIDILQNFGANVTVNSKSVTVSRAETAELIGQSIDVSEFPDLFPVLGLIGSFAKDKTVLYNAGRLRLKESDRITATCNLIKELGGNAVETEDTLVITGTGIAGGITDSRNDHRIAMTAAIAGAAAKNSAVLKNCQAVNKSYPHFFEDFAKLGGVYVVRE
jgi:3-phosphoshikimate 1-carboxyvinyltransferase